MKEKAVIDWLKFEREEIQNGAEYVCGVDEAGRGPLAGPVFAAAVILPEGLIIEGVNDSKKLSEKKREALFDVICEKALAYSIAAVDEATIDEINILQATYQAMTDAVNGLDIKPSVALIDGNKIPPQMEVKSRCIVKGDAQSMSIACASILAKVSRDRFMLRLAEIYPEYEFEKHKGYGTALHVEKIKEYGASPIHRKTFLKKIEAKFNEKA